MRKILITIILLLFVALVLWGIEAAAAGTHRILGDAAYRPFIKIFTEGLFL